MAISGCLLRGLGCVDDGLDQHLRRRTQSWYLCLCDRLPGVVERPIGEALGEPSVRACISSNFEIIPRVACLCLGADANQRHEEPVPRDAAIDKAIEGSNSRTQVIQSAAAGLHDQIGHPRQGKGLHIGFRRTVDQKKIHLPCPIECFGGCPAQSDCYRRLEAELGSILRPLMDGALCSVEIADDCLQPGADCLDGERSA